MNAAAFERLESAFDQVWAMDAAAREAFVSRLRGEDREVAGTLDKMLGLDTAGIDDRLRELADRAAGVPGEEPRRNVGRYRLLGIVGEGGFGVVYLAEQPAPVHRLVAIKVIKPGMDTRHVLARFNDERQALAMMDHASVVAAIDAGTTEDGRPFVVMPLVPGVPITQFCTEQRLAVRERLGLMVEVCRGVQHAHGKGVIHRDLKPANILVALKDGRAQAKIIDFGLAKALAAPLTAHTTLTIDGQLLGTPEYMAPEQAAEVGADARSDVYALGSILYELLAGRPPFLSEELRKGGRDGLRRVLAERVPTPPSANASDSLARELDWIALRCLEKDPARRYPTPDALAADLERFLAGRAVETGPPARFYRLWRSTVRHRWLVLLGAVAALSLVGGSGFALRFAQRSRQDQSRAEQVATLTRSILTSIDPSVAQGRDPELLIMMLDRSRGLLEDRNLDPRVQRDLCETFAMAYFAVGRYAEAMIPARRADDLIKTLDGPDALRRLEMLKILIRGDTVVVQSDEALNAVFDLYAKEMRRIVSEHPSAGPEVWVRAELAIARVLTQSEAHMRLLVGASERALGPNAAETIDALRLLGRRLGENHIPAGRQLLEDARTRARAAFGEDHPTVHEGVATELMAASFCGASAREVMDLAEARLPAAERALGWRHRSVAVAQQNYAEVALQCGECEKSISAFVSALERETATRGESTTMGQYICGNLALAALQCDKMDLFVKCEERLWRIQPAGPTSMETGACEGIIVALRRKGEMRRFETWMKWFEVGRPDHVAALRKRLETSSP